MAGMKQAEGIGTSHRDLRPTEIRRSENAVQRSMQAITSFINPFGDLQSNDLIIITSGSKVSEEVKFDVLRAEEAGRNAKELFIKERLEKNQHFFDKIPQMKLKTMASMNKKTKVKSSKNKLIEYKQQFNIAFQFLMHAHKASVQFDIQELMKYMLTPVPFSIATADNILAKTDKAKGKLVQ